MFSFLNRKKRIAKRCAAGKHEEEIFYRRCSDPDVHYEFKGCKHCSFETYVGPKISWWNRENPQPQRGTIEDHNQLIRNTQLG